MNYYRYGSHLAWNIFQCRPNANMENGAKYDWNDVGDFIMRSVASIAWS